jgi:ketosteroid isomerase-like protein
VMSLMTEDCVFENTFPAPDGERYLGAQRVNEFWSQFFESTPSARFEAEETLVFSDRAVVRWVFHWENDGVAGHVRGIDLFRVRDGKVAEKLSYVKG